MIAYTSLIILLFIFWVEEIHMGTTTSYQFVKWEPDHNAKSVAKIGITFPGQ